MWTALITRTNDINSVLVKGKQGLGIIVNPGPGLCKRFRESTKRSKANDILHLSRLDLGRFRMLGPCYHSLRHLVLHLPQVLDACGRGDRQKQVAMTRS